MLSAGQPGWAHAVREVLQPAPGRAMLRSWELLFAPSSQWRGRAHRGYTKVTSTVLGNQAHPWRGLS